MLGERFATKAELDALKRHLNARITAARIKSAAGFANFVDLLDTPDTFTGEANKVLKVNAGEDAVEFKRDITSYADSPMIITGAGFSNGTNAGTLKVGAITALLRNAVSDIAPLVYVTFAEQDNVVMGAADTRYHVVLTSTPAIVIQVANANGTTEIGIGTCMKEADDTVHFAEAGMRLQNGVAKLHRRGASLRYIELASGCVLTETGGALTLGIAAGVVYEGINRFESFSGGVFDSHTGDTFTRIYRDGGGGFTKQAGQTLIDSDNYDDNSGGVIAITANQYSVHFIYLHPDDEHVYCLYGRSSFKLAEAIAEQPYGDLPDYISNFGVLIGKIITKKGTAIFDYVQMVTDTFFTGTAATDHANLTNLPWTSSAHTGTASRYIGFGGGGVAQERTFAQVLADLSGQAGAAFGWNDKDLSKINSLALKEIATPGNPDPGYNKIYFKNDDKIYILDSDGNEVELGAGGGGGAFLDLTDVLPAVYTDREYSLLQVNYTPDGLKFTRALEIPKTIFSDDLQSGDLNIHQGYTTDGTFHYGIDTAKLYKWNAAWVEQTTNANPFNGIDGDHLGDGDEYDGNLYIPGETWVDCDNFSHQKILVFAATDLTRSSANDISAQGHEAAGLVVVPHHGTNGIIYVCSYCDGSKLWMYKLTDFSYLGAIDLDITLTNLQAVTWKDGYFYLSENAGDLYAADISGHCILVLEEETVGDHEGLDFSQETLAWLIDEGVNEKVHFFTPTFGLDEGVRVGEFGDLAAKEIDLRDGGFHAVFKADGLVDNAIYTLPTALPPFDRILLSTPEGALSWASKGSGSRYGNEVIDENFDDLAIGAIDGLGSYSGWGVWDTSTEDANCSAEIVANPGNGRMLRLSDNNVAGLVLTQLDADAGHEIVQCLFKCDMKISTLAHTDNRGYINIYDNAAAHVGIYFRDNFLKWYTGSAGVNIMAAVAGTWYSVVVFMDITSQKATIWVDGVLKLTQQSCLIKDIESIQFLTKSGSPGSNYTVDFDNLVVVDLLDDSIGIGAILDELSGTATIPFDWNAQNLTGIGILSATDMHLSDAQPELRFYETDRAVDHKLWRFLVNTELFQIFAAKDDLSAVVSAGGIFMDRASNWGFGTISWGANASKVISVATQTAPTTSPADLFQMYSADVNGVAGKAGVHFRDEAGVITAIGGGQIVFPTTQNPSANVNTLDDYEEGSWTPDLQFGGAKVGITYATRLGLYTKIGRQVTCTGYFCLTSKGTSVGAAQIYGLPFTIGNSPGNYPAVSYRVNKVSFVGLVQGFGINNTGVLTMGEQTEAGVKTVLVNTNFVATSSLVTSVTYFID